MFFKISTFVFCISLPAVSQACIAHVCSPVTQPFVLALRQAALPASEDGALVDIWTEKPHTEKETI